MADIGQFIGALIATGVLTQVAIFATRRWRSSRIARAAVCNSASLLISVVFAGFGMADGGPFAWQSALLVYAPAQFLWLIVTLLRLPATDLRP